MDEPLVLLAGFTADGPVCRLSSTRCTWATASHSFKTLRQARVLPVARCTTAMRSTDLIAEYCEVISTDEALDRFTHADPGRWQAMGG